MQYNRDELGFLKSKFNQRDHVQEKWNVLWVTNTTRGNAKEIEINFGFKESNADFSVDKIEKFCVSKSTLSSLLNDPDLTVPEPKPCGNWSNFMESADMSYFWQREDNTLKETNVKVPATVRIQNVQNVPKSVLKPYYPKSTSSSSSSSLPTQKKGTIVPRNSGGKKSDKTPKIQALQKIGDSRSSSQISSQKRSEELKKNEENSSAIYTQADYERLYDEEKADEAGNEDMDDGDNTGNPAMLTLIHVKQFFYFLFCRTQYDTKSFVFLFSILYRALRYRKR